MLDPLLSPLAEFLAARGRLSTVAEAARILEPVSLDPYSLVRKLRRDPRFLVVDAGPPLPGYGAWPAADRQRYAAVLRALDLPDRRIVLLRDPTPADPPADPAADPPADPAAGPSPDRSTADLLGDTVGELISHGHGTGGVLRLAAAAHKCQAALTGVSPTTPAAAPSTTPLPGTRRRRRGRHALRPP